MPDLIDARGLSCPGPVIKTKAALEDLNGGEIVVLVDEEAARENVSRLARSFDREVVVSEEEGDYKLTIRSKSREK